MITSDPKARQGTNWLEYDGHSTKAKKMQKPKWVVQKEQDKKNEANATVWLFGLHAVRDALMNPNRVRFASDRDVECAKQVGRGDCRVWNGA